MTPTQELHPRKVWLTASEAARYAGACPATIWLWGTSGKVLMKKNDSKSGRTAYLYRRSDIEKIVGFI